MIVNDVKNYAKAGYDKIVTNVARRLPVVFCLDVSPSMDYLVPGGNSTRMSLLNAAVQAFIKDIKDSEVRSNVEIAYVCYSTNIVEETDFISVKKINEAHSFSAVEEGGTQTGKAVMHSIKKIEEHNEKLAKMGIHSYAPFLVLITDGNPDDNDNKAIQAQALESVKAHCHSHLGGSEIIVPFIIGIGVKQSDILTQYSSGFTKGYFPLLGDEKTVRTNFSKVFALIQMSMQDSVDLNDFAIKSIKDGMDDLIDYLERI